MTGARERRCTLRAPAPRTLARPHVRMSNVPLGCVSDRRRHIRGDVHTPAHEGTSSLAMGAMHTFSARARIAPCTHPQAAPVERCQTARFRPSAARASRALPSAAYAAVARCRARTILERHTSTPTPCPPSWSRTGRYSARRHSSAERCVALLRVHRTPPDQDVLGAVKRMLYDYWIKVIKL